MEFNYIEDGIDAVVIDNFYTEEQLSKIMDELKFLTRKEIFVQPEDLASAENDHGALASKTGVFLETVFLNWKHSGLIAYPIENFSKKEVKDKLLGYNSLFRIMYHSDCRSHLLSYYQNSDFYKPHVDITAFTILNYFYTEPKKFKGGSIKLYSSNSNKEAVIEIKQNRVVLFPGCTFHEVLPIESNETDSYTGNGRYCNSIFLNLRGDPPLKETKQK